MAQASTITHLLSTNAIPSHKQASFVKRLIGDADDELSKLDSVIADMRSMIRKMFMQRKDIVKRKQSYQSIMSSVRRLTPDVLGEICRATLPIGYDTDGATFAAMKVLSSVCRGWRHAALSTPSLWTSLSITPNCHPDQRMSFSAARRWIDRSSDLPLTLYYSLFNHDSQFSAANLSTIVWMAGARRWKKIEISWWCPLEIFFSQNYAERSWDQLEFLSVDIAGSSRSILSPGSATLGRTPRLKTFKLRIDPSYGGSPFGFHTLHLPWSQLTELLLNSYVGWEEFLEILRHCVNLEECTLCIQSKKSDVLNGPPAAFTMPKLRRLNIFYACMLGNFLSHLCLPILEDLRLSSDGLPQLGSTPEALLDLFSRSGSTLKKLDLSMSELPLEHLHSYFQRLLALVELRLGVSCEEHPFCINDEFLVELTVNSSFIGGRYIEYACLPKLKIFELATPNDGFSMDTFVQFVRSRFWTHEEENGVVDRLEHVKLSCTGFGFGFEIPTPTTIFKDFRRRGLDIEVKL